MDSNYLNNITDFLYKYKTQLLVLSIVIIIIYFAFWDDDLLESKDDKYFPSITATKEQMDKMNVYQEGKCPGTLPVKIDLGDDQNPVETCALYAKGKGWNKFGVKGGVCTTGEGTVSDVCPVGIKYYDWKEKLEEINDNNYVIKVVKKSNENKVSVAMFDKVNFDGKKFTLDEGKYPSLEKISFDINNVKSFLLPPMTVIRLFSEPNFKGKTLKLVNPTGFVNEDNDNLLDKWKNAISSVEISKFSNENVKPYATLFPEENLQGDSRHLGAGEYSVSDFLSMDIRDGDIKTFEVGPYSVVELYADSEFHERLVRVVNPSEYVKKWKKTIKNDVNSAKVMSYQFYKQKARDGVANVEAFFNINKKSYKTDLEEGEYDDLKGRIYRVTVSPNTIVLFKKRVGKDEIFINPSGGKLVQRLCDIDCENIENAKIVRYDEYYKSNDKYVTVYEYPDYNADRNGFEVRLLKGVYGLNDLKRLGIREPIDSLKVGPGTKVTLQTDTKGKPDKTLNNRNSDTTMLVRTLNLNEVVGYEKVTKPVFHNWYGTISKIVVQ